MNKKQTLEAIAKEYSERHQDVSSNLGKYLVQAVFIDGYQTSQEQTFDVMQQYAAFCVKCDREKLPLLFAKEWFETFNN